MKPNYEKTRRLCRSGFLVQAVIVNLAPMFFALFQTEFALSYEQLGRLVLIGFMIQLCVDLLSVRFADRIGQRRMLCGSQLFSTIGLLSLGILPKLMPGAPYAALVIASIIYSIGAGMEEVILSPILESLPSSNKAASMGFLHSFYNWGQAFVVLSTTLYAMFFSRVWYLLPIIWSFLPLVNFFFSLRTPLGEPVPESRRMPLRELFRGGSFYLILIVILCGGACEQVIAQWASMFAERGLGLNKAVGDVLGPFLFAICMGTGRMLYAKICDRMPLDRILGICGIFCVICFLITVFSPWKIFALVGCALSGFAVSVMWPGTLSFGAQCFPLGGTAMFALMAAFGDIGCSVGPWLVGLVADGVNAGVLPSVVRTTDITLAGIKSGIAAGLLFPALLFVCIRLFRYRENRRAGESK